MPLFATVCNYLVVYIVVLLLWYTGEKGRLKMCLLQLQAVGPCHLPPVGVI